MIYEFSVSEARAAIACPRIFYFDEERFRRGSSATKRVTRLWTGASGAVTGCGTLFHQTIERFNHLAATSAEIRAALDRAAEVADATTRNRQLVEDFKRFVVASCLSRPALHKKTAPQQHAFVGAVDQYMGELADVLGYAVHHGRTPSELLQEFFGDSRKRVDVTFHVGAKQEPIRIRGVLDYIYFDYRRGAHRILDFKLMPAEAVAKDLLQTSLYALMHNQQHQTAADVAVLYLHPRRSIVEQTWTELATNRGKVFDLLASMVEWSRYNEATGEGLKPPGEPTLCQDCPWSRRNQCVQRLGPELTGERIERWSAGIPATADPRIEVHRPPEPEAPEEFEECDDIEDGDSPAAGAGGLYLGQTTENARPVILPVDALATHVSILGSAGSGKSWLAKVIAEEAIRHGIPVLAIDPQGDLVQFLRPAKLREDATPAERSGMAAFRARVEVRVWTPGTSHGLRLCLSPLRLPRPEELRGVESAQRRQEEWEATLGAVAGNLVQLAQAGGDEEVQRTFLLEILRKLCQRDEGSDRLELDDIVASIQAPDALGLAHVDVMISKREREKLQQRLYARVRGPAAHLFTGGTPLDLNHFVQPADPGKTCLNVIYLNALPDDSQKQYFVAALAAEVYRWMITTPSTGSLRLLVYLDEAMDFLPKGAVKPPAKEPLLRLFAQGRKFGVGCLICTQSPRSVDYQAFSNTSTKIIGRLEAAQDVQRVAEWFASSGGTPAWLPDRNGAAAGTMVGRWPQIPAELEGMEFRARRLYSLHEGAWSPDQVESEWAHSGARDTRCLKLN